ESNLFQIKQPRPKIKTQKLHIVKNYILAAQISRNMFRNLLVFQWKTAVRSPMWHKNLALNLVVGFFLLLMAFYLFIIGIFMNQILKEVRPDANPLVFFNGLLLYYFLADLLIRFMMQSLPGINIESFLHLPVRKNRIINFMVSRTIFDVFNLIPLFILIPVIFTIVKPMAGGTAALIWILSLMMMILANSFIATWLKRLLGTKPVIIGVIALLFITLVILDKTNIISLSFFSQKLFGFIVAHPAAVILPFLWMILTYGIHYWFLITHLFPDEVQVKKSSYVQGRMMNPYLRSLGLTGTIIELEMKLYGRNKRPKTILQMSPLFLLYGFFFYPNPGMLSQDGFLMFVGVFLTGGIMLNYLNYSFGYESCYFDTLLTKNIDFAQYVKVKYINAIIICTLCYILTIPYVYYGLKVLLVNTAMYFYNIGLLSFSLLYFATYNKNRMDLTRGATFNYQGLSAMNWLVVFPAFLVPLCIFIPFNLAGYPDTAIAFVGGLGLLGLFFTKGFLRLITRNFYKRKYAMAENFRQK
ncbi:MAG: DUF5687 family protein, partial [Bacteroidetes bacterium]|nr:DUF5687 family protein [Bacteroidota bacterium]